jgi:SNF2 family DNA or RNA helicase
LHIHFRDGFFLGIGEYEDKHVWKQAGFTWTPTRGAWVTDKFSVALRATDVPWTRTALAELDRQQELRVDSYDLSWADTTDFQPPVPPGMHPRTGKPFEFFPYQRAGIEFAMMRKDTLIGDAPGLGKSPMGVGVFNCDTEAKRVLVICPASLKEHWRREFELWKTRPVTVGIAEAKLEIRGKIGVYKTGKRKGENKYGIIETIPKHWPNTDVVIINYDILDRFLPYLNEITWDILICDEAHALKTIDSGRTCYILGGGHDEPMLDDKGEYILNRKGERRTKKVWYKCIDANRRLFLTGTPMMNRPIELWPMLKSCDPNGLGKDRRTYGFQYCNGFFDHKRNTENFDGASHLDELGDRLRSYFMIRRLKKDVLPELPPKDRKVIILDSKDIRDATARESEVVQALRLFESMVCRDGETEWDRDARLAAELADKVTRMGFDTAMAPDKPNSRLLNMDYATAITGLEPSMIEILFTEMATARRELGMAKLSAVHEWTKTFLDGGEKILLFAYHTDFIKALQDSLKPYKPAVIHGGVPAHKRQGLVDMFQDDEDCRLGLLQIDAAGVGYTLTRAKDCAFGELDWVSEKISQAYDRICRIGQKADKLMGFFLVANGTLDVQMANRAYGKEINIETTMDSRRVSPS